MQDALPVISPDENFFTVRIFRLRSEGEDSFPTIRILHKGDSERFFGQITGALQNQALSVADGINRQKCQDIKKE